MLPLSRLRAVLLALVVALLAGLVATGPATAAGDKGLANGAISCPGLQRCPGIKVLWFDQGWGYLGQRKLGSPQSYSLTLAPGTYHLQFVDQRPSYDVTKYAPTDIQVTVRANDLTSRNVTMWKGAAITGKAVDGRGRPLRNATVVAASRDERSFSTVANPKGEFAVGGLPQGQYSVFTYDTAKAWVGKSTWAGAVKPGQVKDVPVRLTKRAGELTVYLFTPNGLLTRASTITVTSVQTGQWWTRTSSSGTFVFKGLYPGGYRAKFDGAGVWFAATGAVQGATVHSGKPAFGKFRVTKRGGWVSGTVVDGGDPSATMADAQVRLFNAAGQLVASTVSDADGLFELTGQLATQDGMTVIVDPKLNSGGWMQGGMWCKFAEGTLAPVSIFTGEETYVGDVELPRSTEKDQTKQCLPAAAAARR